MAEVVGVITCPLCETRQEVRQEARRAACLYISCKNCGTLQPRLKAGQAYMDKHTDFEAAIEPEEAARAPAPVEPPDPAPAGGGWWAALWSDDE